MRARTGLALLLLGCQGDGGAEDTDRDTDAVLAGLPVEPLATCTPGAPASTAYDPGLVATSRADVFYPYGPGATSGADPSEVFGSNDAPAYPEASIPDPTAGRRVQIAAISQVTGTLLDGDILAPEGATAGELAIRRAFQLSIGGRPVEELLDDHTLDWVRVWPREVVMGGPVWIAFHTRDPAWSGESAALDVVLPTDAGDAVKGSFRSTPADVIVTMVQPSEDLATAWIHLHNRAEEAREVTRLVLDGLDVTGAACLADPVLAPGETALVEVPLGTTWIVGSAWTLVVELDDGPPTAAVGRVLRPFFPIHTWPSSSDCPLPGVNDDTFKAHAEAGYDTFFARSRYTAEGCEDVAVPDLLATRFREEGVFAMADEGFIVPEGARDRVPARLIGDEVDNKALDTLVDIQKMRQKAEETNHFAVAEPEIGVYVGGSRHRFTGMFAGSTDIQGMDFYVDGCAPHITDFGVHPPLRGAYDYLRATRDNHLPNPTWLYTQGFSGAWRGVVPGPTGATVQTWSVIAAGGKGLMTFQTSIDDAGTRPDTWSALASANHSIRALRPWLRLGDPTDAAHTDSDAIVQALRVPGGLVLVVIGLTTTAGPDELSCLGPIYQEWVLDDLLVDVDLALPDDVGVQGWFEVVDGRRVAIDDVPPPRVEGRTLRLSGIPLDDDRPARVFVLHADNTLVDAIAP